MSKSSGASEIEQYLTPDHRPTLGHPVEDIVGFFLSQLALFVIFDHFRPKRS